MSESGKMEKHVNAGYVRLSDSPAVEQTTVPYEKSKDAQGAPPGDVANNMSQKQHDDNMSKVKEALLGRGSLQLH
ncbi:hypothetical protein PCL_09498 [Purpureocillium lilacinum]|uniref:Uncharacterized protein n=1 Tax=Purpureocillium lilacinum TaxID=33203 RepID=A0A2U3DQT8_PURLI|nr:hypothetical protein Purlil1_13330 [Purpureocillium lilacinum]PWI64604.1 hypothetical protein PCL_09498 [Purpureocillium lilacinum]